MLTESPCPSCMAESKPWANPRTQKKSQELIHTSDCEIVNCEVSVRCDNRRRVMEIF